MTRREAREEAFYLVFEMSFGGNLDEILETAEQTKEMPLDPFTVQLAGHVRDHAEEIDQAISTHSKSWKISRLSKVVTALLRMTIGEICYQEDVPTSVSINEAVELAKKYGGEDDSAYLNGVLGAFVRANPALEPAPDRASEIPDSVTE